MDIIFKYTNDVGKSGFFIDPPAPAKLFIPEWYKDMPLTIDNQKKAGISPWNVFASNSTVKACSPFLDALTSGYIYSAPSDIEVRPIGDGKVSFRWRHEDPLLTDHHPMQFPGLPNPVEVDGVYSDHVIKWASPFIIKTPPGYSCLFTHPFNRHDLPFRTLTGVVDTDSFALPVQFPFQMSKDVTDILIIERGTPVCQIIPFKRDAWKHSVETQTDEESNRKRFNYFSKVVRPYKRMHWSKKTYE